MGSFRFDLGACRKGYERVSVWEVCGYFDDVCAAGKVAYVNVMERRPPPAPARA